MPSSPATSSRGAAQPANLPASDAEPESPSAPRPGAPQPGAPMDEDAADKAAIEAELVRMVADVGGFSYAGGTDLMPGGNPDDGGEDPNAAKSSCASQLAAMTDAPRRVAPDGHAYTRQEFIQHFGLHYGLDCWARAPMSTGGPQPETEPGVDGEACSWNAVSSEEDEPKEALRPGDSKTCAAMAERALELALRLSAGEAAGDGGPSRMFTSRRAILSSRTSRRG